MLSREVGSARCVTHMTRKPVLSERHAAPDTPCSRWATCLAPTYNMQQRQRQRHRWWWWTTLLRASGPQIAILFSAATPAALAARVGPIGPILAMAKGGACMRMGMRIRMDAYACMLAGQAVAHTRTQASWGALPPSHPASLN